MKVYFKLALAALLASIVTANAQQAADPRVKDLVQAGRIRVGRFLPQFTKNPVTGKIRGDVHLVGRVQDGLMLAAVDFTATGDLSDVKSFLSMRAKGPCPKPPPPPTYHWSGPAAWIEARLG